MQPVIMMICCRKKAVVDTTDSYDEADYQESVQLDEEGCYEVTAQVKDSEGNFTDITLNVYVDAQLQSWHRM